jgi:peptidoglycan/LPS O-acetylase OafA/YrhL
VTGLATAASSAEGRRNNFDLLRLGAALLVVVSHSTLLFGPAFEPFRWFTGYTSGGDFAVLAFFSISGFLVSESWFHDPHTSRFFARRLLRVVPALATVTFLSALALGPLVTTLGWRDYWRDPASWTYLLNALVFPLQYELPGVFTDNPFPRWVNGSLWTLQLEFSLYIVLMLVGLLGRRAFRVLLIPLICALLLVHLSVVRANHHFLFGMDPRDLATFGVFFFMGAALREFSVPPWACGLACLPFVAATAAFARTPSVELTYFGLIPCLVVWLAFSHRDLVGRLHLPGDYSYGIYVFAFPVQQLLAHSFHGTLRIRTLLVLSIAATTIVGMLSWHWIEKPALQKKPQKPGELGDRAFDEAFRSSGASTSVGSPTDQAFGETSSDNSPIVQQRR